MENVKYRLWEIEKYALSGVTDLKSGLGKIVDINGCTLIQCNRGFAVVSIDLKKVKVRAGDLVILIGDATFIPIDISKDFFARYVSAPKWMADEMFYNITSSSFWEFIYRHPVLSLNSKQKELLQNWFFQTDWMVNNCTIEPVKDVIKNNFYNLFVIIDNELKSGGKYSQLENFPKNRAWILFNDFYTLLDIHHSKHHNVNFYAQQLNITPDYLYKIVQKIENVSPKEIINRYVIVAIKTLLQNTDLSVKNIATELNFDDVPYMCRFFRRNTGLSPLEYRHGQKKMEFTK